MITTVTLNPSIDKAYYLEKPMVPGTVMRVRETINNAGGKGINVAKNVKLCWAEVVATGFLGGFNGQYLEYLLAEKGIAVRRCDTFFGLPDGYLRAAVRPEWPVLVEALQEVLW